MTFHPDVILPNQRDLLVRLGPIVTEENFYLAGGTAAAIQVGHRRSVDLDWFTAGRIPDPLRLARQLKDRGMPLVVEAVDEGTLHAEAGGIRVSFFEYRYRAMRAPVTWDTCACRLAAPEDLACMKLSAITGRGVKKDFVDIYALCRAGLSIAHMLELYQQKFEIRDIGHVVYSLSYFDEAETTAMPEMIWNVTWEEIKATIERWVADYSRSG